ncbi:Uncharacterized protein TCM_032190 [Theobroma cacao]|uniref:Uncharacterized protein n=1 Tax=Theobroma cacao TaxID=3641 RepID=A0A061FA53_THECC|nr:Uncharacterized protein TCM_032190 [Theobroma cacao]
MLTNISYSSKFDFSTMISNIMRNIFDLRSYAHINPRRRRKKKRERKKRTWFCNSSKLSYGGHGCEGIMNFVG